MNRFALILLLITSCMLCACPDKFCDHSDECLSGYLCNPDRRCIEADPFEFETQSLPPAFVDQPYQTTLLAQGGLPDYTWSLTTDQTWLSLSPSGTLSGTPENPVENASIQISVKDSSYPDGQSLNKTFSLTIHSPACDPNPCTGGQDPYRTVCSLNQDGQPVCSCIEGYETNDQDECVHYDYQCTSDACGADLQRKECKGSYCTDWTTITDCTENQVCLATPDIHDCRLCEYGCGQGACLECASGPCCDDQGQVRPDTTTCDQGIDYQCSGTGCGDDIQKRNWVRLCNGKTPDCEGEVVKGNWELHADCASDTICQEQQDTLPICNPCEHGCSEGACLACTSGPCCQAGQFKPTSEVCEQGTNYQCASADCGADVQMQIWVKRCSGSSAACEGESILGDWQLATQCADNTTCQPQQQGSPICSPCEHGCNAGECLECSSGPCCDPQGHFKLQSESCEQGTDYRCENTECGADAQRQDWIRYCDGESSGCNGTTDSNGWELITDCAPNAVCQEQFDASPICSTCDIGCTQGACLECCTDICCDPGETCRWNDTCGVESKLSATETTFFGRSVSISGDVAIIGSTGAAHIFRKSGFVWVEEKALVSFAGPVSVSVDGEVAIVGDWNDSSEGTNTGIAYIFRFQSGSGWVQEKKIIASDAESGDFFGFDVSISGDLALVGAPGEDTGGSGSGAAYVFHKDPATGWEEEQKFLSSHAETGADFGSSVSISGDYVVIGAYRENEGGAAYIFNRLPAEEQSGWWEPDAELHPTQSSNSWFGRSVAIANDVVVVGDPMDDAGAINAGTAYVFRRNEQYEWVEEEKLLAHDAGDIEAFGESVAVHGDSIVVGAYFENDEEPKSGSAYIFQKETDVWVEKQKLIGSLLTFDNTFGSSVSVNGDILIVGAPNEENKAGTAYVY